MKKYIFPIALLLLINSCANRGVGPQGGPKDTIPPTLINATPENNSINFNATKISLEFDEYLQLNDVSQNVFISPPTKTQPTIKSVGKNVSITLEDTLKENTTYSISFGNAICDNNEKNPLSDFTYSFSTGNFLDSLEISGRLLNAADLNPIAGVTIGVHSDMNDETFGNTQLEKISRTDNNGNFTIRKLAKKKYHVFALKENMRDYIYQPSEPLAFYDSIILPEIVLTTQQDTLFRIETHTNINNTTYDTTIIDTIITKIVPQYTPNDLLLFLFEENFKKQFLLRPQRDKNYAFTLFFNAPQEQLPQFQTVEYINDTTPAPAHSDKLLQNARIQHNNTFDTITFWLLDTNLINNDTIPLSVTYEKTDSAFNLYTATDTVLAIFRKTNATEKAKQLQRKQEQQRKVQIQPNYKDKFDFNKQLLLHFDFPISAIDSSKIQLLQKQDTSFLKLQFQLIPYNNAQTTFLVQYQWEPDAQYQLALDSAAVQDIYGKDNDSLRINLKTPPIETYATIIVKMEHFQQNAIIQLLNEREEIIAQQPANENGTRFEYLEPKDFYLRLFIDHDKNGQWTTGNYNERRQPEPIYYHPNKLTLKANWEFEETFDHLNIPQTEQKPTPLVKTIDANKAK